jgi:hypothetical protein
MADDGEKCPKEKRKSNVKMLVTDPGDIHIRGGNPAEVREKKNVSGGEEVEKIKLH